MSAISASASSILFAPVFTRNPSRRETHVPVEHRVHGDDAFQLGADRRQVALLETRPQVRAASSDVGRDGIPAAEHEVVERGEGHEVADERVAPVGAAAETDSAICETDPIGASPDRRAVIDPRDEGRRDGTESGEQHTELAGGGGDLAGFRHPTILSDLYAMHHRGARAGADRA